MLTCLRCSGARACATKRALVCFLAAPALTPSTDRCTGPASRPRHFARRVGLSCVRCHFAAMAPPRAYWPLLASLAALALLALPVAVQGRHLHLPLALKDALDDARACHNSSSSAVCLAKPKCAFCESSLLPSGCFYEPETLLLPTSESVCAAGVAICVRMRHRDPDGGRASGEHSRACDRGAKQMHLPKQPRTTQPTRFSRRAQQKASTRARTAASTRRQRAPSAAASPRPAAAGA